MTNGLLLRSDIHTLFDLGLMALDPSDYRVMISKILEGGYYQPLAGRTIRLPAEHADRPSRQALEFRLAEFKAKNQERSG